MKLRDIINNKEIQDIPILYILRIISAIQEEEIKNGKSCNICEKLSKNNERVKE